jgi:uncharacterized secreted protein with C-terminal beta-propeller domain
LERRELMAADVGLDGMAMVLDQPTTAPSANLVRVPPGAASETFTSAAELEQFLRRDAERRYGHRFGQPASYPYFHDADMLVDNAAIALEGGQGSGLLAGFSGTNNQVTGVEEADVVKTDGRYLFIGRDNDVVIVDAQTPAEMRVVSRLESKGHTAAIYLSENRLTVISASAEPLYRLDVALWQPAWPFESELLLSVYDVSSLYDDSTPDAPQLVSQLEVEGDYVDSRMIGETVYLVSGHAFYLPPPEIVPVVSADPVKTDDDPIDAPGPADGPFCIPVPPGPAPDGSEWVYETREQYWARISDQVLDRALPNYELKDGGGTLYASGLLSHPENTYQPLGEEVDRLISITAVDVGADAPGIVGATSAPIPGASVVYVSPHNLYLVAPGDAAAATDGEVSEIFKFALDSADGTIPLVARGQVPGHPLNRFSLDEQDGYLRVVTQSGWRTDAESALYVLEPVGTLLVPAARIENLAPGEHLYGVRFQGDRAFVVTFGTEGGNWYDPLFTINLSDPHAPRVEARLQISGFSNYLQIIDQNFLIGLGRNADPTNGQALEPQLSLFDVANFNAPKLLEQLSIGSEESWSEAFTDHHAISYFPDYHILAIPVNSWSNLDVLDGGSDRHGRGTRGEPAPHSRAGPERSGRATRGADRGAEGRDS